jgi:hypothetical protein
VDYHVQQANFAPLIEQSETLLVQRFNVLPQIGFGSTSLSLQGEVVDSVVVT